MKKTNKPPAKKGASKKVLRGTFNPLAEVGEQFRMQRAKLRLSIVGLAQKSQISEMTIAKFENGKIENTSVDTLQKLAEALEMELSITVQ